jgi:hypothetical protein
LFHQTKKKRKMKATTIILAAVLSFSMNILYAGSDVTLVNSETNPVYTSLAPDTPTEATFNEMTGEAIMDISDLAPVAPFEADFSDVAPETMIDFSELAPTTPVEADFSSEENQPNDTISLAPITPAFADFTETI